MEALDEINKWLIKMGGTLNKSNGPRRNHVKQTMTVRWSTPKMSSPATAAAAEVGDAAAGGDVGAPVDVV